MATKICINLTKFGHPIVLRQDDKGLFNLQYDQQIFDKLSYKAAMMLLGASLMNTAASKGLIETDEDFNMIPWEQAA